MLIHHAPDGVWSGLSREVDERDPVPPGWIMAEAPPPVPAGKVAMWVDGWIITDPPEPPALTAAACLDALADLRWQRSQHFVFDGVMTQADPAIAVVNATLAMRDRRGVPTEVEQTWKLSQADFRQWDEAQIEAFGFAVADHIQACFDREAELSALIVAAADPASVDITAGWPD